MFFEFLKMSEKYQLIDEILHELMHGRILKKEDLLTINKLKEKRVSHIVQDMEEIEKEILFKNSYYERIIQEDPTATVIFQKLEKEIRNKRMEWHKLKNMLNKFN